MTIRCLHNLKDAVELDRKESYGFTRDRGRERNAFSVREFLLLQLMQVVGTKPASRCFKITFFFLLHQEKLQESLQELSVLAKLKHIIIYVYIYIYNSSNMGVE